MNSSFPGGLNTLIFFIMALKYWPKDWQKQDLTMIYFQIKNFFVTIAFGNIPDQHRQNYEIIK